VGRGLSDLQKRILSKVNARLEWCLANGYSEWCDTGEALGFYPRARELGTKVIGGRETRVWIRNDVEYSRRVDVSRAVTRLAKRGLIEIKRHNGTYGQRKIRLTPSGVAYLKKMEQELTANPSEVSR